MKRERGNSVIALRELIFHHYARNALLPILAIEVLLLAVYFGSNAYHSAKSEQTLRDEASIVMPHLADETSGGIDEELAAITRNTGYYASVFADLFSDPDSYLVPGEQPEFAMADNGTMYQTNRTDKSSLFIAANAPMDERQMLFAAKTAAVDSLSEHMVRDIPNVVAAYLNTPDNMNRLYPYIPEVYQQYPANLTMKDYNFFYLADAEHNPDREPVWTGVYLDPAGQGWMLSCVAPVYSSGDRFEGVVGLDVTVDNIVTNVLRLHLPWDASAFMVDQGGMILAMGERTERLLGLVELRNHVYDEAVSEEQLKPDEYNLLKSEDQEVARTFGAMLGDSEPVREATLGGEDLLIAQSAIAETGWRLMVTVRTADLYASVDELTRVSRLVGAVVVVEMLLFYSLFFLYLRRQARGMATTIADPVARLTTAAERVGTGGSDSEIDRGSIQELNQLTDTFNTMSRELDQRSRELVETRVRAQLRKKDAELAFARGQYETASGYLHNVGNAVARFDASLLELREILRSAEQYPEVFERLRSGDQVVLGRFEEVLLERTLPRLRSATQRIADTKGVIQQTIAHQQADFDNSFQRPEPQLVDLSDLVTTACDDAQADIDRAGITLTREIERGISVLAHEHGFRHGVQNLIKNAREASSDGDHIAVSCVRTEQGAEIVVTDSGEGIDPEHLSRVMSAGFTTKPDGHGLGLHSFAVFLAELGGRLEVTSEGIGRGTRVRVEVRDV